MLAINIQTPSSVMEIIKESFKQKRLSKNLTQEGLADRSGVSLGSLKRFESSGQIALESLLKIAFVLGVLENFAIASTPQKEEFSSMADLLKSAPPKRKRGAMR